MLVTLTKNSFNAGVFSPQFHQRYKYDLYNSAVADSINNYAPLSGCSTKRSGTELICSSISDTNPSRLISFQYAPSDAYIIEIGVNDSGQGVFRFYTKGGQIVIDSENNKHIQKRSLLGYNYFSLDSDVETVPSDTVTPYEVNHSYKLGDIGRLYVETQCFDNLYIFHPSYPPAILQRAGHTDWTLTNIKYGSTMPAPTDLTATEPATPPATTVESVDYIVTAVDILDHESIQSNVAPGKPTYVLNWTATPNAEYYNVYKDPDQCGKFYWIAQANDNTFTEPEETIDPDRYKTPPIERLPFETVDNYPAVSCLKEQRLLSGNTNNKVNMIKGSVSGDFYNMNISSPMQANDAYSFDINSQQASEIRWMLCSKAVVLGCSSGIWILKAGTEGNGIRFNSFELLPATQFEASYLPPVEVGNTVIFVDSSLMKVRDLSYNLMNENYDSEPLTVLCDTLFNGDQIQDVTFQRYPNDTFYFIHKSGKITSLNYSKPQKMCGFAPHSTQGNWESLATINTEIGTNEVYISAWRNGKRFIEIFKDGNPTNKVSDCWYVDSGLTASFSVPTRVIGGLDHLEGQTVCGIAGGDVVKDLLVSSGQVTLPFTIIGSVTLGLPINHFVQLLDFTIPTQISDNILERVRKICKCGFFYYQSGDIEFSLDGIKWRRLQTGWNHTFMSGNQLLEGYPTNGDSSTVWFRSLDPTPCNITAVSVQISISDELS